MPVRRVAPEENLMFRRQIFSHKSSKYQDTSCRLVAATCLYNLRTRKVTAR